MSYPVYYVEADDTLPVLFDSFDGGTGASITLTGLAATDIEIYKDGGTTQRASDNGYTLLDTDGIDFDGITGIHGFSIDLSDNSDAGFYAVGAWYHVVVSSVTIDGQTVNFIACAFRIVSATRGMAGTALPDAAADAAGGLPVSDAGGLDLDTQIGTDIDAILVDTNALNDTKIPDTISLANINSQVDTALADVNLDHLVGTAAPANPPAGTYLDILADDGTATYDRTTDSLQAIRDRGDAAWTTGGGGSITDILNVIPLIPQEIDLANTATWRIGLQLINSLDDLPSTAEIDPGTISIDRKAIGGTSWSAVVTDAACSELAGLIYYDEVFDSGTGYAEGDSIRVTFKSQKITVSANDYEIADANGRIFYTGIRQTMRGTDSAALASVATEARLAELDAANIPADIDTLLTRVPDTISLAAINAEVDTALTDYDAVVPADLNDPTAATIADAVWDEAKSGHVGAGSFGEEVQAHALSSEVSALNDLSAAEVNAEVLDVLNTDTFGEPTGVPPATASIVTKLGYVYMKDRNRVDVTATDKTFYDDGGSAEWKKALTDDGTTYSEAEGSAP